MEKGEILDEIFDLKPIFPEIYSHSSMKPQISNEERKCSPPKMKISMQLKNSPVTWNNNINNNISAKLISFENSNSNSNSNTNTCAAAVHSMDVDTATDYSPTSDIINFSSSAAVDHDASSNDEYYADSMNQKRHSSTARTPSQALDHVMAERKRRQNLSQLFISLSKAVPGLKKLDKASLLEDGIKYLKTLQERVRVLEEEEERRSSISAVAAREDSSSYNSTSSDESEGPEIQARISDKHVLIKIFCKKEMGLMSRIPSEIMEKMHLNVVDMRIMPFGTALHITILAQMQGEFEASVKDIVDHLHTLFSSRSIIS